jgi:hypothetical protein
MILAVTLLDFWKHRRTRINADTLQEKSLLVFAVGEFHDWRMAEKFFQRRFRRYKSTVLSIERMHARSVEQ